MTSLSAISGGSSGNTINRRNFNLHISQAAVFQTLLACGLLLAFFNVNAQTSGVLKGIVADSAKYTPLPFVNVQIKNTTKGTQTNAIGEFSLAVNLYDTLRFSSLGFFSKEFVVNDFEEGVILLTENATLLKSVTVYGTSQKSFYETIFEEENKKLKKANRPIPFYYSKGRKDKIEAGRFKKEEIRVDTYVSLLIKSNDLKNSLIARHRLTEAEYYSVLTEFNKRNYTVMYYLTAPELITLINRFFAANSPEK